MNEQTIWIGIDLGGTNVRVAAVDQSGTILEEIQQLTDVEKGPESIINSIINMTTSLQSYPSCSHTVYIDSRNLTPNSLL